MAGHTERSFEDATEAHLLDHNWFRGNRHAYDVELGLDPASLINLRAAVAAMGAATTRRRLRVTATPVGFRMSQGHRGAPVPQTGAE